eukprot:m.1870 g.1870  ORF g.1870 m.1870 type:complete len:62 (+) comp7987_c0_seq1:287-472(+)
METSGSSFNLLSIRLDLRLNTCLNSGFVSSTVASGILWWRLDKWGVESGWALAEFGGCMNV